MYRLFLFFLPTILCDNNSICPVEVSQDCPHNPDIDLSAPQIARRYGYPIESHFVTTEDGYILTLHRIPGPKNGTRGGQVVVLQHGLLGSSADWVVAGTSSLAFILADAGYDVWIGNSRGNTYSKAHINLTIESSQFWNFSWHEMGVYDVPAFLNYVNINTNKSLIYIGHSMGTTMFFVFAALRPQLAKIIKFMIALAPVAYMAHLTTPFKYLAPFSNDLKWLTTNLGINEFKPNNIALQLLSSDCRQMQVGEDICDNVIFAICGYNKDEFNKKILPVVLSHTPAGSSTKTLAHYGQEIKNDGKFQQYDYGRKGNQVEYGMTTPPQYQLSNIEVKTYLMYAPNDSLADPRDAIELSKNLPNNVGLYEIPSHSFGHVDFLYGKDAPKLVYDHLMKVMLNYTE